MLPFIVIDTDVADGADGAGGAGRAGGAGGAGGAGREERGTDVDVTRKSTWSFFMPSDS